MHPSPGKFLDIFIILERKLDSVPSLLIRPYLFLSNNYVDVYVDLRILHVMQMALCHWL